MRRRGIVQEQAKVVIPPPDGTILPELKAKVRELMERIHQISAAQSQIWDTRVPSFDNGEMRCRHCHNQQKPKGLASHERWCPYNPNRGVCR